VSCQLYSKFLRRYWTTACLECPLKSQCTKGPERRITRWEHEHLLKAVQQRLDELIRRNVQHPRNRLDAPRVRRLHEYLASRFPFSARITIADNASTDATADIADRLSEELPDVRVVHLAEKGRGRALRAAWSGSDAQVLAYMDVDLSTGLDGLLPLSEHVLCVSGRLSFELVQKAAVAGCPIVVTVGAPSSLALELAEDRGVTLCGFAREGRLNVYTEAWRVLH